jgi:hypothetical protein
MPVWVTAPAEKFVSMAETSSPAPMADGFVLASVSPHRPSGRLELFGQEVRELGGLRREPVGLRVGDVIADRVEIGLHGVDSRSRSSERTD